jgi:hypothetical protein
MSVIEVTPQRQFRPPSLEGSESHLLARLEHADKICLAGITAVMNSGVAMLEWAIKTENGIVYPTPGTRQGHLVVKEVVSLDFDPTEEIMPEEIINLPRTENSERLLWQPASLVYGLVRASEARLGYRSLS